MALSLVPLLAPAAVSPTTNNPPKLARTARFDLLAEPAVGTLAGGEVLSVVGQIERMNWLPAAERERGYTINFPINHFSWTEFALRFVPASNGVVKLQLMGPYEEAAPGLLFRQEVLYDEVKTTGTPLTNGGFEQVTGNRPDGWLQGGGVVNSGPMPPYAGANYARTWHNRTLTAQLAVKGGEPVTVRLMGRAIPPPAYKDLRRIVRRDTAAQASAKLFLRGVNLGNYLEAPPGQNWGATYTDEDFKQIQREGFDHVRIPIGWHHYAGPGPEFTLAKAIFDKADFLVTNALSHKLNVLINLHHYEAFYHDPAGQTNQFYALWRQIGAHYATYAPNLAFELLNEPMDKATTLVLNPIYAEAIRQIRLTNPHRAIFVGPGHWNSVDELGNLYLPYEEDHLIITVHCYEPFYFTHQGATWAGPDVKNLRGIVYPGPPPTPFQPEATAPINEGVRQWLAAYNTKPGEMNPCGPRAFRGKLWMAKQWSDFYGRPIHLGEFGAYEQAQPASRARFYRDFRQAADELGLGWALWDWKAGFKYWDAGQNRPAPGMREAMFPTGQPARP